MGKTKIFLIRHCESLGNISNRFMGHTDIGITEKGALQLEYLAERFKDVPLDLVYSSPLKRTVLTAAAANKHHGLEIIKDASFIEINMGDFENVRLPDILTIDPECADNWSNHPHRFASPNGESMQQVYDRAFPAVQRLAAEHPGKNIAIATHGCFIRNAVCRAMGYQLENINEVPWSNNTGVTLFEFDENGNWEIVYTHDLSHLPQEIIDTMVYLPKIQRAEFEE